MSCLVKTYRLSLLIVCLLPMPGRSQSLIQGKVILNSNDTIDCAIIKYEKREKIKRYNVVDMVDSVAGTKKIYPRDIKGYLMGNSVYRSYIIDNLEMFAEQIESGKATLYYYGGGGDKGNSSKYIFQRGSEPFFVFDPSGETAITIGIPATLQYESPSGTQLLIKTNSFIPFFSEYLKDCPIVMRKIQQRFYTGADMRDIFSEYNKVCGKDR